MWRLAQHAHGSVLKEREAPRHSERLQSFFLYCILRTGEAQFLNCTVCKKLLREGQLLPLSLRGFIAPFSSIQFKMPFVSFRPRSITSLLIPKYVLARVFFSQVGIFMCYENGSIPGATLMTIGEPHRAWAIPKRIVHGVIAV